MTVSSDGNFVTENVGAAGDHGHQQAGHVDGVPSSTSKGKTFLRNISVLSYLKSELTRGYMLERDEFKYAERRERVYTFMKTPRELEKFCTYGFFLCLDAFLFIFTLMPVRILIAVVRLFTHPCGLFSSSSRRYLESAHICDLLKGIILFVVCLILDHIDVSMMYHLVRGQSVIKLYVFYNMLDVCDRLFSGFGQDILDSLFWTATEPRGRRREHVGVLPHLLLAIVYVIMHTLLILSQATVLNVAFNSHNKALLTIMISNNFVEIKGSLFKRVDKNNLFQISCSDVKERFHYAVLLSVVFVRNMAEFSWKPEHVWLIIPDVILVLGAEFIVDWIKHAFVTKFNEISSDAYQDFTVNLVQDMASSRQKHAFSDLGDQVSRRMGLTPIPLACLLIRIITKSVKISGYLGIAILVLIYFCLLTFKMLISIILLGHGSRVLARHRLKSGKTKPNEVNSQVIAKKAERDAAKNSEFSSTIQSETQAPQQSASEDSSTMTHTPVTTASYSQTVRAGTTPVTAALSSQTIRAVTTPVAMAFTSQTIRAGTTTVATAFSSQTIKPGTTPVATAFTSQTIKPGTTPVATASSSQIIRAGTTPVATACTSPTVRARTGTADILNSYWEAEGDVDANSGWMVQSSTSHVTISQCSSSSSLEFFSHGCPVETSKSGTQTPDSEYFELSSHDIHKSAPTSDIQLSAVTSDIQQSVVTSEVQPIAMTSDIELNTVSSNDLEDKKVK